MAAAYLSMSTCVKYALVMEMSAVIGGRIALIFVPYIDAAMRTGCNFLELSTWVQGSHYRYSDSGIVSDQEI